PDAPIAVAGILLRRAAHRFEHGRIAQRQPPFVAQSRACNADQLAGAALREPSFDGEGNLFAPGLRAHHFRRLISLSVSIAISRSASMRLSLAFSVSSWRSRLTSAGSNAPNF